MKINEKNSFIFLRVYQIIDKKSEVKSLKMIIGYEIMF